MLGWLNQTPVTYTFTVPLEDPVSAEGAMFLDSRLLRPPNLFLFVVLEGEEGNEEGGGDEEIGGEGEVEGRDEREGFEVVRGECNGEGDMFELESLAGCSG